MNVLSMASECFCPIALAAAFATVQGAAAQTPDAGQAGSGPIAIVPLDSNNPENGAKVRGALEVANGKAIIAASGEITSGTTTTQVTLPRRGTLRVCASTTVKLAADSSVPSGVPSSVSSDDGPGLMMAIDHGAIEASYATGRNADVLMTPDFRILISGPGAVEVKIRLGEHGDTCIDNPGADAPYVLVSSVFEGGAYRVQPGQRVMFQHGSLHEVVDNEKEPCGCPPAPSATGNEFPLAQSEGLAPLPRLPRGPSPTVGLAPQSAPPLVHNSEGAPPAAVQPSASAPPPPAADAQPTQPPAKKAGFFHRIGNFFRRIFGAE